ncbi:hypothetical protein Vretifemale_12299 [Volvox reticuliferus]|uniref:Methyltransferase domain-containing protein n=1 Tax=Volvox reticuliferus TaxID=1737510 RepID=A0A8J4CKR5_9CHLO|nr:hypothetical protein Vretifemale_12299 [Volvox reticuliferus]
MGIPHPVFLYPCDSVLEAHAYPYTHLRVCIPGKAACAALSLYDTLSHLRCLRGQLERCGVGGECTWLLSRRCRYIVGVDKSPATIAAARRRYPGLRFEEVDGFDVPTLKALGPPDGSGFSVVLVDIGGIASLSSVAALVGLYYKEFPFSTKIVVKSVFLKRLVEDCLPYNTEKSNPWALLRVGDGAGDNGGTAGGSGSTDVRGIGSVRPDLDSHPTQKAEEAEAEGVEEEAEEHVEGAGEGPAARARSAKGGFRERQGRGSEGRGANGMRGSTARGTERRRGRGTGQRGQACREESSVPEVGDGVGLAAVVTGQAAGE